MAADAIDTSRIPRRRLESVFAQVAELAPIPALSDRDLVAIDAGDWRRLTDAAMLAIESSQPRERDGPRSAVRA